MCVFTSLRHLARSSKQEEKTNKQRANKTTQTCDKTDNIQETLRSYPWSLTSVYLGRIQGGGEIVHPKYNSVTILLSLCVREILEVCPMKLNV